VRPAGFGAARATVATEVIAQDPVDTREHAELLVPDPAVPQPWVQEHHVGALPHRLPRQRSPVVLEDADHAPSKRGSSRAYVSSSSSGRTRVSPTTGMKFVSPF